MNVILGMKDEICGWTMLEVVMIAITVIYSIKLTQTKHGSKPWLHPLHLPWKTWNGFLQHRNGQTRKHFSSSWNPRGLRELQKIQRIFLSNLWHHKWKQDIHSRSTHCRKYHNHPNFIILVCIINLTAPGQTKQDYCWHLPCKLRLTQRFYGESTPGIFLSLSCHYC